MLGGRAYDGSAVGAGLGFGALFRHCCVFVWILVVFVQHWVLKLDHADVRITGKVVLLPSTAV